MNNETRTKNTVEGQTLRRNLLKLTGVSLAAVGATAATNRPATDPKTSAWDKTFPPSERVNVEKVSFVNRLGINIVGDLYVPKNLDRSRRSPAIMVGHPYGGVKEQTSGLYAQQMAERGFVTLAFDNSYGGESGGSPRSIASPEAFTEDFSAAADFLGTHALIDRQRIGVIGVCGSGGFAISAAQIDPRLRAVATVSMYDMGRASRQGLNDSVTLQQRMKIQESIAEQRLSEFAGTDRRMVAGTPKQLTEDSHPVAREFFNYYRTPRGRHPRSTTEFTFTSTAALNNFFPFAQIETISPRPLLFIAGEAAHSRYFSEDAFRRAAEPKELHIVPGAGHVDLYDRLNHIPFDKLKAFFDRHLS